MKLYGYWRSTTSYRIRIALNLKGLTYETVSVDLVAGEQFADSYQALNPIGGVPSLELEDGTVLTQSMSILNYLETVYPTPPLLPVQPVDIAKVEAAAYVIACDIHPVNNLKVVSAIKEMGHSQNEMIIWMNSWIERGLKAYQAMLPENTDFSFGNTPSLADICLIPQLYNARRWGADFTSMTRLLDIETRCLALPAFAAAQPERQPDANLSHMPIKDKT